MTEIFQDGGLMMWPLLAVTLAILWIGGRTALRLRDPRSPREDVGRRLNMLLFWGAMGLALGALGTVVGLVQAAQNIQRAGSVSGSLVAGGVAVTLITLVFGFLIFILAGLLWLPLHLWRQRVGEGAETVGRRGCQTPAPGSRAAAAASRGRRAVRGPRGRPRGPRPGAAGAPSRVPVWLMSPSISGNPARVAG